MLGKSYFWTSAQEAILSDSYKIGNGLSLAQEKLPEKHRGAIATKAHRMKLTTPKPRKNKIG